MIEKVSVIDLAKIFGDMAARGQAHLKCAKELMCENMDMPELHRRAARIESEVVVVSDIAAAFSQSHWRDTLVDMFPDP